MITAESADPIDVVEEAIAALGDQVHIGAVLDARIAAWLTALADEAREHQQLLREADYPKVNALLAVNYRHPLAVAEAILDLDTGGR